MKYTLLSITLIVFGLSVLLSSGGSIKHFDSNRAVDVNIVDHDCEYVATRCCHGYSAIIGVCNCSCNNCSCNCCVSEGIGFVFIRNYLIENKPIDVQIVADYSSLPDELEVTVDNSVKTILPLQWKAFRVEVDCGKNVSAGVYYVPIEIHANWDGGNARINTCPIKIVVFSPGGDCNDC